MSQRQEWSLRWSRFPKCSSYAARQKRKYSARPEAQKHHCMYLGYVPRQRVNFYNLGAFRSVVSPVYWYIKQPDLADHYLGDYAREANYHSHRKKSGSYTRVSPGDQSLLYSALLEIVHRVQRHRSSLPSLIETSPPTVLLVPNALQGFEDPINDASLL